WPSQHGGESRPSRDTSCWGPPQNPPARRTPATTPSAKGARLPTGTLTQKPRRPCKPHPYKMRARFHGAFLRFEIDVNDPEPFRVAEGPFEIVEERPDAVAAQIDTA